MTVAETQRAVDAVWRLESARIIAGLARLTGDLGLAEDLAQDALVAALSQWPGSGIPPNPGAWLMSTARHRAIDRLRRDERLRRNLGQLGHELHGKQQAAVFDGPPGLAAALDAGEVQDDLLRLMFVACHPVLSTAARVALTLRLLGGLSTGRDRPGLPGRRAGHRAAHRPGQAHPGPPAGAVRGARAGSAGRPAGLCARGAST